MELAALKAFIEVAREGSFSLAAETLYLTQPAVSKRIAGLEQELAVRLFDRVGRQIFLTEAGRHLLPRAEQMLQEEADIRRSLSNLSGEVGGRLAMATSHHIGLHRLPPTLRTYSERFPGVALDIQFMESERACLAVAHGELELAVITLPLESIENLTAREIWHDPLCVAVGRDHPLAKTGRLSLGELVAYPAVLPSRGTYTRTLLEQAVSAHRLQVNCTLETGYLETLKTMTGIGLGWGLLPEILMDDQLTRLEVPELALSRSLGMVTHHKRTLSNAAIAMTQLLTTERKGELITQHDRPC